MATNKKSFILYADQSQVFNQLPDELAGRLIKHVFAYVNDENPLSDDLIINVAFTPIMLSLKRDLKKWDTYIDKQKVNGAKGGRPKAKETQKTQAFKKEPKKADSVSVSDSDSDSVNDILLEKETKHIFDNWIQYRKEINKPIKSKASLIALKEAFSSHSFEACKFVVNASIENCWQGLFWDKAPKENIKPIFRTFSNGPSGITL